MSKKGAQKTGGTAGRMKAANQARAAFMAAHGIKRTTFRDPVTYKMKPIGALPGVLGGKANA